MFLSGDVAPWFSYIVLKPYGNGHFLNGVSVSGNKFRSINGSIDRAERVDTSFSGLDFSRTKNVFFEGNTFHNVDATVANPLRIRHEQSSAAKTWTIDPGDGLPFGGRSRGVDSVIALGAITTSGGSSRYAMPYADLEQGSNKDQVGLVWEEAVRGEVQLTLRLDK